MKIFSILFLVFIITAACNEDEGVKEVKLDKDLKVESRYFRITTNEPDEYSIKITNKKSTQSNFKFIFNGNKLYGTIEEIIKDIEKMDEEFANEPIVRKVWRFTTDNSKHNHPLTDSAFYHLPQLFFNSTGFGYCDDRSMVNSFLWKVLGYESRVWGLSNHVVSEVLINGRWEMYDSMQEVYYNTKDGKVAGVEDIVKDPGIVVDPSNPVIKFESDIPNAYSEDVQSCYLSKNIYAVDPVLPRIDFQSEIFLKTDFYIQFPYKHKKDLKTAVINNQRQDQTDIMDYTNFIYFISIPSTGIIPYPLFIHSIEGNGSVSFDQNKAYRIGSKELNDKINKWDDLLLPLYFQSFDSIKINYLLNPIRFKMNKKNTLIIYGDNIDSIDVQLVKNPE